MKNSGGKDTVLLFAVLLLALGALCYLCVIKKNLDKLSDVRDELTAVEQEKQRNDAIIQQADQLDQQKDTLISDISLLEGKFLPELNSASIERQLYKHFEDEHIPYIVKVENTALNYETVSLPNGTVSTDRVIWASYTITVSGTDGFLLTHNEADDIEDELFYNQLQIPVGDLKTVNPLASKYGIKSANDLKTNEIVGYNEFVKALSKIESDAPEYVKISDIQITDVQGFCEYSATVDVFAYDLVNRKSPAATDKIYQKWVGVDNIATGGLVGFPSYFFTLSPNYNVPESSPLYGVYLSLSDYDFNVNRAFAAWNHWSYEWQLLDGVVDQISKEPSALRELDMKYYLGMISTEDYAKARDEYMKQNAPNVSGAGAQTTEPDAQRP